jgi:hypothetical protein
MTENTHTPGPWKTSGDSARYSCRECPITVIATGNGAQVAGLSDGWDEPTLHANARLIAEAPTLLGWAKRFQAVAEGIASGAYPASVYDWAAVAAECGKSIARTEA